jgi:hypothetical protein
MQALNTNNPKKKKKHIKIDWKIKSNIPSKYMKFSEFGLLYKTNKLKKIMVYQ